MVKPQRAGEGKKIREGTVVAGTAREVERGPCRKPSRGAEPRLLASAPTQSRPLPPTMRKERWLGPEKCLEL